MTICPAVRCKIKKNAREGDTRGASQIFLLSQRAAKRVAQICNLLYRRFVIGSGSDLPAVPETSSGQQIENLLYGRLQIRATREASRKI